MLNNIKETLDSMICDRQEEIAIEVLEKNPEYKEACKKASQTERQIMDLLPEEHKHLVLDYESAMSFMEVTGQRVMYEKGFNDGIEVKNMLKQVVGEDL